MNSSRLAATVVAALSLFLGACAGKVAPRGDSAPADERAVSINVRNNTFSDMKVYAVLESGNPLRLGVVNSLSASTFTATPIMFPTGMLRVVATPVGGRGVADSGPMQVSGGEQVQFTIPSNPAASYALIRWN